MASKMTQDGIVNAIITYSDRIDSQKNSSLNVFKIKWGFFILAYFKYFLTVLKIGKKYDIIYLQGSFIDGLPTIFANFFLRKRIVIRIGGIFAWEYCTNKKYTTLLPEEFYAQKQNLKCEFFKTLDRFVISHCHEIIVNSNYMKKLLALNNIDPKKISVIFNAVNQNVCPSQSRNALLKKFNLPDKKIILSHGRLVSWKNFEKLIYFAKELNEKYILVIVGDGPEKTDLLALIKKYGLQDKVIMMDKQDQENIYQLNSLCDIFALLSSYEGLSNALVEVMQQNRPIIASAIEPNIEALQDYANYKLININIEEFTNAVDFLENARIESISNLEKFNFENIYKKTLELLCAY